MFEWFTGRLIMYIFLALIAIGAAVAIWEAIPGIIKVIAVIGVIVVFINTMKK